MAGRVYAITGVSGVLGAVVARAARAQGARLAGLDFVQAPPPDLTEADDVHVLCGVDLADANAAGAAIDAAADRFGGLDVLLNIAGGFRWEALQDGAQDTWHKMFLINVQTATNASRAAI